MGKEKKINSTVAMEVSDKTCIAYYKTSLFSDAFYSSEADTYHRFTKNPC